MKHIYSGGLILGGLVVATLLWQQSPGTDRPNPFTPRPSDPALNLPRTAIDTADPSPTPTPTPTLAVLPLDPDLQAAVNTYMERLTTQGMDTNLQAVWVESSEGRSGGYQADVALPAASLTKMATTLLALERWAADYRFFTRIATTGPVVEGVLQGDLVVWGGADPFYVWESAIALGNRLNTLGISQVAGNLVIDADPIFVMNFERDRSLAGELLRQGLDARLWGWEAIQQFQTLPTGTPEPQVEIQGGVVVRSVPERDTLQVLVTQPSLPLVDLLKEMNKFSNNIMADLLADLLGGGAVLTQEVQAITQIPAEEITLINGSGLGPENQISARGVCRILNYIAQQLEPQGLGLSDVMPIAWQDAGTLDNRDLPTGTIAKTGTLWNVSTLGGLVPQGNSPADSLDRQPSLCFAILNQGVDLDLFRSQQDGLLAEFKQLLQPDPSASPQTVLPEAATGTLSSTATEQLP